MNEDGDKSLAFTSMAKIRMKVSLAMSLVGECREGNVSFYILLFSAEKQVTKYSCKIQSFPIDYHSKHCFFKLIK